MKNELAAAKGLPAWLDGRTVAIVGTVFTVGIGLGAMVVASSSATRAHVDTRIGDVNMRIGDVNMRLSGFDTSVNGRIDDLDHRLSARIDDLDHRLGARIHDLDHRLGARIDDLDRRLSARIDGLDRRLSAVLVGVAEIRGHLGVPGAVGREDRKTGTGTPLDAAQDAMPEPPR